jgi:hypothetical protein
MRIRVLGRPTIPSMAIHHMFASVVLIAAVGVPLPAQNQEQSVRATVHSFCDFELKGAQDPSQRAEMVEFSGSRLAEIKKNMGAVTPYLFEWEVSPLEVIQSFKVGNISVSGPQANAYVDYVIVARRDSWGGPIKSVPRTSLRSQLQLREVVGKWKVMNPAYPRVSGAFLSTSYRSLFQLPETWYQQASSAQLLWLRNGLDNILLLDSLDAGPKSR